MRKEKCSKERKRRIAAGEVTEEKEQEESEYSYSEEREMDCDLIFENEEEGRI